MKPILSRLAFQTFWQRLGDAYLFTWGYVGFHFFSMLAMRIFLNYETLIKEFAFWSIIFVIEHVFIFSIYGLAKIFIKKYSAMLVLVGALVIGFVRTVITTGLALEIGIDANVSWGFQLVTGALYELVMVGIWANVNGAYRSHKAIVAELSSTKNEILGYRENAEEILREQQENLVSLTRKSLLPQLMLIEEAIAAGVSTPVSRWGVAQELKGLINNQVRPLSEALRRSARDLAKPSKISQEPTVSILAIPKRFFISHSIFPGVNYLVILLGFIASPYWLLGLGWVPISALFSISYLLVLVALKRITAPWPEISAWLGVPLLVIFSVLPVLPSFALTVLLYPNDEQATIFGLSMMTLSAVVFLALALLDSFDFGSRAYRAQLDEQVKDLAYETALFEQQLWAARRNWSLVIHGTVQASLTAALTRLNSNEVDETTSELAKKDLERAISALTNPPVVNLQLARAIEDLAATWQGVCEIEFEISAQLKKIFSSDANLAMCVNEILKEAVSNAVRHGDAKNANIEMKLVGGDVVELKVSNDGTPPSTIARKGLGSALLDELTLAWKLSTGPNREKTVLLVTLPHSKKPA